MKNLLRLQSNAVALAVACLTFCSGAQAGTLNISSVPLFLQDSVIPLNMLVLGRDHKLYYEAYNDASDLNPENEKDELDVGYKPGEITYYGYFDSFKCYNYNTGVFVPVEATATGKTCPNSTAEWSGDWLNYVTTSRIDALRKVLYGGFRSSDPTTAGSATILERSFIPQDAHSWGKEYESVAKNGYDLTQYTPLPLPAANTRHLFANTTPLSTANPLLRVLKDRSQRIWNWVSIERAVAGTAIVTGINASGTEIRSTVTPTDYAVRVQVCKEGLLEDNCRKYPDGAYKPIGLLQEYGEDDAMYFGLLSGSYQKNTSGGVLRRVIGSIRDEVDYLHNGNFLSYNGIITSLNRLRTTGFGSGHQYACGWTAAARPINESECQMWGNPIAEMMYEGLRYFAGKASPSAAYKINFGEGEESSLTGGGLPVASWDNPYNSRPVCSKPFETVISDINPSYDTDQLPGTSFGSYTGDLTGLNVTELGQKIWDKEIGASGNYFIGQVGSLEDGAPTPKAVASFGNIRGLAPEEPTKKGGYYSASVSHFGKITDLNSASGDQKVNTFAVALASPLPQIKIKVGEKRVTLVPFAKSVAGSSISATAAFQPTDQIVDFYVDTITDAYGKFRVNFEDVEQGADHDMDAIAVYEYTVKSDGNIDIKVTSEYAAGGITQHMGYVISGTTADGTYLEVVDQRGGDVANDVDYRLDTPPGKLPNENPFDLVALPTGKAPPNQMQPATFNTTRTFTPGDEASAQFLKDPLWYAAKWGGFKDGNDNDLPDVVGEWDEDENGVPDNYFLVTNALKLGDQLRAAFEEIIARVASASSASVNSGSVSSSTRVYQAKFNSGTWTGQLLSYPVNTDGTLQAVEWDAATKVPAATSRRIITVNSNGTAVPFRWDSLDDTRKAQIEPAFETNATLATNRLNYLRGDDTQEQKNGGAFRDRPTRLGDIVASAPLFVGPPSSSYGDALEKKPYSEFRDDAGNAKRTSVVYAGANDGMLHAFSAETGEELLAYIPSAAYTNLRTLSSPSYAHKFFVDGSTNMRDVFFDNQWHTVLAGGLGGGGQGIYALNITDPDDFSESNAADLVLWEFGDKDGASDGVTGDADLGYTYSQPAIVRLQNGKWAAIFGNGYNNTEADGAASTTGDAVLYIVDVEDGTLIKKISTLTGTDEDPRALGRPNGLATPAVVDLDGDRTVDYVFAGDLFGNMWKFNIKDDDPANWTVAYGTATAPLPLFSARGSQNSAAPDTVTIDQAITSRPEVVRGPRNVGMMVLFGTGKYLETSDKMVDQAKKEIQTYYGLFDKNTGTADDRIANRTLLNKQTILAEQAVNFGGTTTSIRVTSQNPLGSKLGWYLDLLSPNGYNGERQVSNTTVRGSRVIFTTLIPDTNPCNFGGSSWLMELDTLSGGRLEAVPFDQNNDGLFNEDDMVTITIDGVATKVPVSGVQPNVGITSDPGILFGEGAKTENFYLPGTTGDVALTVGSTDPRAFGRQSWRQVR